MTKLDKAIYIAQRIIKGGLEFAGLTLISLVITIISITILTC